MESTGFVTLLIKILMSLLADQNNAWTRGVLDSVAVATLKEHFGVEE
jgi:hypothetical protein